jgi:DNA gyrase subunit A
MGKYHPHGDVALYDALVRWRRTSRLRYPLVDGQGNFGSVDGDPPAAMRYTEARMTAITDEMLADIEKETVDFVENYDGTPPQPSVLPAKLPNLLVNGSVRHRRRHGHEHPAAQPATRSPTRDRALIDNPELTNDDLCEIVTGPDFPTGGDDLPLRGARNSITGEHERGRRDPRHVRHGRGRVIMRGQVAFEEIRAGRMAIVVTELPYQVNKATLAEKIADLVSAKKIDGIATCATSRPRRHAPRHRVQARRVARTRCCNNLFKHTALQTSLQRQHARAGRRPAADARLKRSSSTTSTGGARSSAGGPSSTSPRRASGRTSSRASRSRSTTSTR